MGQTLTHGVYLPDEGERNCYSGLAANWQILDTSVGTIAAHTAALAGKAPAVHTHTKSDITDFPAYGNTAGTICEGNDSRLSDARTPVAHTHGKADITDLFNSANIWSASQTFGDTYIKNSDVTWGVEPSSAKHRNLYFSDSTDIAIGYVRRRVANGSQGIYVAGRAPVKNGQLDPTGDLITWGFSQIFLSDGSTYFQFDGNIGNSIIPRSNNTYDLGSSTLKWKTLNGVNPGALSFPSAGTTENTDWYNVAGEIKPTGGNSTNFTGNMNLFTPPKDGWLSLVVNNCSYISVWDSVHKMGQSLYAPDATKNQQILLPVLAGYSLEIRVIGSSWFAARLFMPKGNV